MTPNAASPQSAARSRTAHLSETVSKVGFNAFAILCAAIFIANVILGQAILSRPNTALFCVAWCPFFWSQYYVAKLAGRRKAWFALFYAIFFTAMTILGTVLTLLNVTL